MHSQFLFCSSGMRPDVQIELHICNRVAMSINVAPSTLKSREKLNLDFYTSQVLKIFKEETPQADSAHHS